jgi:RNA polymerase sigma-70 factor (ECF subfamily)
MVEIKEKNIDPSLIFECGKGDSEAFAELVRKTEGFLYNYVFRLYGSPADTEDICQEIYIKIWRSASSYRGEASPLTWICKIAKNTCIDLSRRRKISTIPLYEDDGEGEEHLLQIPADESDAPEEKLIQKERADAIRAAFDTLEPSRREILLLREIRGLSYEEIASCLDLETGTVKSRISRARKELASLIQVDN